MPTTAKANWKQTQQTHKAYEKAIKSVMTPEVKTLVSLANVEYKAQQKADTDGIYIEREWRRTANIPRFETPSWWDNDVIVTGNLNLTFIVKVKNVIDLVNRFATSSRYKTNRFDTGKGVSFRPHEIWNYSYYKYENGEWTEAKLMRDLRAR